MKNQIYSALFATGGLGLIDRLLPMRLTVLAYHRIADVESPDFVGYPENVSATEQEFRAQLAYLSTRYQVIDLPTLLEALEKGAPLPDRPAVITFDDGYRDNYTTAFPVLQELKLPATIFLTTDFIDTDTPFYWDVASEAFRRTNLTTTDLPFLGIQEWRNATEKTAILRKWIAAVKAVPDTTRQDAVTKLATALKVTLAPDLFQSHMLTWAQVCEMSEGGITFGSHGCSHGILARMDDDAVEAELQRSQALIKDRIGKPATAFAYPNGQPDDYDERHVKMLAKHGYSAAFTLNPGPARQQTVAQYPHEISRILVSAGDSQGRFVARLVGERQLAGAIKKFIGRA